MKNSHANKWERAAMRFAAVRYVARQEMLEVAFENGDKYLLATEVLLPATARTMWGPMIRAASGVATIADARVWSRVRIGETGDVLEVPVGSSLAEVPWDRIRGLADPGFREHLADVAACRARRLGKRIKEWRLQGGLTRAALAKKVGVATAVIAGVEAGSLEPLLDLLGRIAGALGKQYQDLAEE